MKNKKINILFFWLVIIFCLQLSIGLRAVTSQIDLDNRLNIGENVEPIALIDTPQNITNQVLIIFVDGMRYDRMLDANTPTMDALRANGTTFANFRSVLPSYSRVNYAAFSTGSSTNFTDVFSNAYNKELKIPTFYDVIKTSTSLSTGIVTGSIAWQNFLGASTDNITFVDTIYHGENEDEKIKDAALATIEHNFSQIQLVTFNDVDGMGHKVGAASNDYLETIERIDSYIAEIIALYSSIGELNDTSIVLFSDHGMADVGGHGSDAEQETHATLIVAGKGITNKGVIVQNRVGINSVTPTILGMLGLPLAPTMNGKVLLDKIELNERSKAIYQIQMAEIMNQQLEAFLLKTKLLSDNSKAVYQQQLQFINQNVTLAKNSFTVNNFSEARIKAEEEESNARMFLSALTFQYESILRLVRNLIIISIITVILFVIFFLRQRKVIELTHSEIFTKELLLPEFFGAIVTTVIIVGMFLIFGFDYTATQFNSAPQALIPNLTAFSLLLIFSIFSPWLFTYMFLRKKREEYLIFRDWRRKFVRSSIGTIAILSLPIFGFFLFYISKNGPWPSWILPDIAEFYAYMVIVNLSAFLYLIAIILLGILWFKQRKEKPLVTI